MDSIYFDHAASTAVLPQVASYYASLLTQVGNSSAIHKHGQATKKNLEAARETFAEYLKVTPSEIIFTSGGTESNNFAIKGIYQANQQSGKNKILVNTTEHHSILDPIAYLAKFFQAEVIKLTPDKQGIVSKENLQRVVEAADPHSIVLVALMQANNETGVIQPLVEISNYLEQYHLPLVVDGVASFAHQEFEVDFTKLAAYTFSGHKFGAPPGVGGLFLNRAVNSISLLHGGGQERKLRAGSVNVPGVMAMAKALEIGKSNNFYYKQVASLRDYFEEQLASIIPFAQINGKNAPRLPGISSVTFPGSSVESMLLLLDTEGISCSSGAACTAGVVEASHVLMGMGLSKSLAGNTLRFSFSAANTKNEIDYLFTKLPTIVQKSQI